MFPNLFHFATSELSQDAVLCWLLSWANNKHKESHPHLHDVAKALLCLIYRRAKIKVPTNFSSIDIRKQDGGIDVLCVINNEMVILIEDKVGTKQHSDQLARYKDHVFNKLGFAADKVIPVYIQTGDQSDYIEVEKHGYHALGRHDLLKIFRPVRLDFGIGTLMLVPKPRRSSLYTSVRKTSLSWQARPSCRACRARLGELRDRQNLTLAQWPLNSSTLITLAFKAVQLISCAL